MADGQTVNKFDMGASNYSGARLAHFQPREPFEVYERFYIPTQLFQSVI